MDLIESYRKISQSLWAESAALDAIHHAGERGNEREALVDRFLSPRLPERFEVGRGEIWAANGKWSGQEDLIVFDRLDSPRILPGANSHIFAVEYVAAVVEVKTSLNTKEIERATQSIASARRLQKTGGSAKLAPDRITFGSPTPIMGAVFAFATDLKFETFYENWTRIQFSVPEDQRINLACVLGEMFIIYVDNQFHLWDSGSPDLLGEFIFARAGDDSLLSFLLPFLRVIAEFSSGVPNLFKYVFGESAKLNFEMTHAHWGPKT